MPGQTGRRKEAKRRNGERNNSGKKKPPTLDRLASALETESTRSGRQGRRRRVALAAAGTAGATGNREGRTAPRFSKLPSMHPKAGNCLAVDRDPPGPCLSPHGGPSPPPHPWRPHPGRKTRAGGDKPSLFQRERVSSSFFLNEFYLQPKPKDPTIKMTTKKIIKDLDAPLPASLTTSMRPRATCGATIQHGSIPLRNLCGPSPAQHYRSLVFFFFFFFFLVRTLDAINHSLKSW